MANKSKRMNFDNILKMVREEPETVFEKHARMLSDLSAERIALLKDALSKIESKRKAAFFRKMESASLDNFDCNFVPIARLGFEDEDGEVRASSIAVLGFDDSREIAAALLEAAKNDPYPKARIAAIQILGQYMFESAVENRIPLPKKQLHDTLAELIENENAEIRRAAVISYSISETKRVKEIISGYLAGKDTEELITGLIAARVSMADDWNRSILELLHHDNEEVMIEAVKTTGPLQMREALPTLYEIISRFDRISPELLLAAVDAVAEIGDEGSLDVLEMLGEAAVDMDEEITEAIDDSIDTLNMSIQMGPSYEVAEKEQKALKKTRAMLDDAIEKAKDRCLSILEEKIPHDLEDDEAIDIEEEDEDECECGCGEHHHHEHHHHHHEHENPLEGLDISRFRILDDLEEYEKHADRDEDEEELWAAFEDMDVEDLDADSLQDFIAKLENQKKKKK